MSTNIDLSVQYMGLNLKSPILASSSDFTNNVDSIIKLEQAGAGAVVLKSLFEEQILFETDAMRMNNMFDSYSHNEDYVAYYTKENNVNQYLKLIEDSKQKTNIPVIASVNCATASEWVKFTGRIQNAGADAIELNVFTLPSNPEVKSDEIRQKYFDIIDGVKANTNLPVAVKMHYYFTDLAAMMVEISKKVDALVLFNRFFNPDIDIDKRKIVSGGSLSSPEDHYHILRWIGILNGMLESDLSASGGIHTGKSVIKSIMSGANVVQVASALYKQGSEVISEMTGFIKDWLSKNNYSGIDDIRGVLSSEKSDQPDVYERAQFMKYFSDFASNKK